MGKAAIFVMRPGPFEQSFVPLFQEASNEIWLWLAQLFLRRRCLKSVDDGRTDYRRQTTEAYISNKFTSDPSAQVS